MQRTASSTCRRGLSTGVAGFSSSLLKRVSMPAMRRRGRCWARRAKEEAGVKADRPNPVVETWQECGRGGRRNVWGNRGRTSPFAARMSTKDGREQGFATKSVWSHGGCMLREVTGTSSVPHPQLEATSCPRRRRAAASHQGQSDDACATLY